MRDVVLGVAEAGLFDPRWSLRILEEWARAARKIVPHGEMIARGKYALSQLRPLGENCAFLVDGYVAGGAAFSVARRSSPHAFFALPPRGSRCHNEPSYAARAHSVCAYKVNRAIGASGIHGGTMSLGNTDG